MSQPIFLFKFNFQLILLS